MISSLRRNLQREYVERLIDLSHAEQLGAGVPQAHRQPDLDASARTERPHRSSPWTPTRTASTPIPRPISARPNSGLRRRWMPAMCSTPAASEVVLPTTCITAAPTGHRPRLDEGSGRHGRTELDQYLVGYQSGEGRCDVLCPARGVQLRRDLSERRQHETALMRPRMRQREALRGLANRPEGNEVEIERPRRVGTSSLWTPGFQFPPLELPEKSVGCRLVGNVEDHHGVDELG
jgi:hypothetical protein